MYTATIFVVLTIMLAMSTNSTYFNPDFYPSLEEAMRLQNLSLIRITLIVFFFFGIAAASILMSPMSNKTKRISFLANPSSSLEKFIYRWLIVTVGYTVIFLSIIYLADAARIFISYLRNPKLETAFIDFSKIAGKGGERYEFYTESDVMMILTTFYLFMQSVFILGSTFWAKNSLIKTSSACLIIVGVYALITNFFSSLVLGKNSQSALDQSLFFFENTKSAEDYKSVLFLIFSSFAIIFWVISYFRFKESEIINRW